ncbi:hypothetical protein M569_01723, partial [Genlisea aurea]
MTESAFIHAMEDQLHLPINEMAASPIGAQLFDFSETELFTNSEVDSTSNCCHEEQQSSYQNQGHHLLAGNSGLSIIFDDDQIDNDISASIDFTASPPRSFAGGNHYLPGNQEAFAMGPMNAAQFSGMGSHQYSEEAAWPAMAAAQPQPPAIPLLPYEDEYLPYLRMRTPQQPSCSLVDPIMPPYFPASSSVSAPPFSGETAGIFHGGGFLLGTDLSHHDLEFQGDNGNLFLQETPIPRIFNDLQTTLSCEGPAPPHFVHGGGVTASSNPLSLEMTTLEDPNFKVEKLSAEERKRKIHIYMKKRNERNFSKKIKYACRKTLADSRPRVRGRFAKNDELCEIARTSSTHEDDTDEDTTSLFSNSLIQKQPKQRKIVGMKGEEDELGSGIFAQINGRFFFHEETWLTTLYRDCDIRLRIFLHLPIILPCLLQFLLGIRRFGGPVLPFDRSLVKVLDYLQSSLFISMCCCIQRIEILVCFSGFLVNGFNVDKLFRFLIVVSSYVYGTSRCHLSVSGGIFVSAPLVPIFSDMGLENDAVEEEETAVESKKPKGNSNHLVLRGKTKLSREEVKLGSCTLELLVPNIPKHITTSDEKYVLRCLEAIHSYASRTRILPVDCVSTDEQQQHQGVARFASVFGDWSVVSISSSQSMQNILKSPLLKQFGSADSNPGPRPPTLRTSYLPSSRAEAAV